MRFKRLDLNLLVALDAMLSERSISRAAERLHLSQSAMSNALARLREYFDDELLVQVGRKLELTPRAETLKDAVRDVLVRVDSTIAAQPEFTPAESDRVFRLLVSDYSTQVLMPHAMELAWQESRTIRFELLPQIDQPDRMLERGDADLLLIPNSYCSAEHPTETVYEDDYSCVVWSGNRGIGETLSFEHYTAAGHVAVRPATTVGSPPAFEGWFMQRYGVTRRIEVTTSHMTMPVQLVIGTERIATVHTRLARVAARTLPVRLLPPPLPIPKLTQVLQWHKYRTQDPGIRWLRELLHRAAARLDEETAPAAAA
ncbi:LysR family transcriptional regulator [Caldimonas tepidiphila]|uniref:LysR family transcriptional regulator n=1 Tax=Caldimonas tepidiphila TaxID=2315841 RepID=UPI000E5C0BF2|nr:LysR family transcriptional regulator [Caldimonas tepidiphila]